MILLIREIPIILKLAIYEGELWRSRLTQLCDPSIMCSNPHRNRQEIAILNKGTKMKGIFLNTSPHKINAWEGENGASGSGAMKMSKFFSKD
jgi:hypothetical protein